MIKKLFYLIGINISNNNYDLPLYVLQNDYQNFELTFLINNKINYIFIYKIIILVILSWKFIFNLIINILNFKFFNFLSFFFDIFIFMHFLLLNNYCISKHFINNLKNHNYSRNIKIFSYISLIYSTLFSITCIILFNYGYYFPVYSDLILNLSSRILLSFLMFFDFFYTNFSLFLFFSIFIINMLIHYLETKNLSNFIKNNIQNNNNNNIKISSIAKDFSKIQNSYENTVDETFNSFSLFNLFGFINLYVTIYFIQKKKYLFYNIYYSLMFCIIDVFFVFILQKIKHLKLNINNQISSESFIYIFFNSSIKINNLELKNKSKDKEKEKKIINILNNNKKNIINIENNIDWINLQQIIKSDWKKYYIFGMPIDDLTIINKLFAIFLVFSIGQNLLIIFNS